MGSTDNSCPPMTGVMFNQAAQIWNHTFYWNGLRPNPEAKANPPTGAIKGLIERDFGSFEKFQEQFTAQSIGHFGQEEVTGAEGEVAG
jgi:Fe-Mn family superoxide dismutase